MRVCFLEINLIKLKVQKCSEPILSSVTTHEFLHHFTIIYALIYVGYTDIISYK